MDQILFGQSTHLTNRTAWCYLEMKSERSSCRETTSTMSMSVARRFDNLVEQDLDRSY